MELERTLKQRVRTALRAIHLRSSAALPKLQQAILYYYWLEAMQLPHQLQMRAVFVILLAMLFAANQVDYLMYHVHPTACATGTIITRLSSGAFLI